MRRAELDALERFHAGERPLGDDRLDAPPRYADRIGVVLGIRLAQHVEAALVIEERLRLPRMRVAEIQIAEHREAGILAGPVDRRRGLRLQHAGRDGVQRLEHARDRAGGERLDRQPSVGELLDPCAEILEHLVGELGRAPHRLATPFRHLLRLRDRRCADCRGGGAGGCSLHESPAAGLRRHLVSSAALSFRGP